MLFGVATMAPAASATSCYQPSNIAVNGGRVSDETTLDLSADGGVAVSTANGGDGNAAAGGAGGAMAMVAMRPPATAGSRSRMPTAA